MHGFKLPASVEAGWLRAKEISRRSLMRADGAVLFKFKQRILCLCLNSTTPSAGLRRLTRLFLDPAATPPQLRRGVGALILIFGLSSAGAGQVERHLSNDHKLREWTTTSNSSDDVQRVKVCRVDTLCKMRFKEGKT